MAYSSWSVVFGEQPSAAKWNILGTNDASFNDGTGIADGAVTVAKRSGGFFVGAIADATLNSTGNKAITGVGFTPKLVKFKIKRASGADVWFGEGAMDEEGNQYYVAFGHDSSANAGGTVNGTTACIALTSLGSDTIDFLAAFVSMDADGFTINVSNAITATQGISFEAYG